MKVLRAVFLLCAMLFGATAQAKMYPDEGEAYAGCQADGSAASGDKSRKATGNFSCTKSPQRYSCAYEVKPYENGAPYFIGCANFSPGQNEHDWPQGADCSKRPEETGWKGGGESGMGSVCHNGCAYTGSLWAGSPTGRLFEPNGQTCGSDMPPPESADPGDGGGESGGGGGSETGGGDDGGNTGGGDNGGGNNGGGGGGGGDDGDGDGGDGDGDGGGLPGGGGTTPGDGSGGAPGATTGRLYQKSGKTVAKVVADFKASIDGAPILSKVKGFFGGCTGGGTCPNEVWDGGQYAGKFDLASLCSGPLLSLFGFAGFVFLAGMSVVALRWALL